MEYQKKLETEKYLLEQENAEDIGLNRFTLTPSLKTEYHTTSLVMFKMLLMALILS